MPWNGHLSQSLNRDSSSLPFDHNRVQLKYTSSGTDYVNASWIRFLLLDFFKV
jgi:protein tyrosine phosphatase